MQGRSILCVTVVLEHNSTENAPQRVLWSDSVVSVMKLHPTIEIRERERERRKRNSDYLIKREAPDESAVTGQASWGLEM